MLYNNYMKTTPNADSQLIQQTIKPQEPQKQAKATPATPVESTPEMASDQVLNSGKAILVGSAVGTIANPLAMTAFMNSIPEGASAAARLRGFTRFVALPGIYGAVVPTLTHAVTGHHDLKLDFLIGAGSGIIANTAILGTNPWSIALGATAGGLGAVAAHAVRNEQSMMDLTKEVLLNQPAEESNTTNNSSTVNTQSEDSPILDMTRGTLAGIGIGTLAANLKPLANVTLGNLGHGTTRSLIAHNKQMAATTIAPAIVGALAAEHLSSSPEAGAGMGFITGMITGALVNINKGTAGMITGLAIGSVSGAVGGYISQK